MADDGGDEIIDELEKEAIEREEILKNRKTKWDAFVEVYYSREDLNIIAAFDKRILERADMLNQDGKNLARIFTILMSKMHKDDLKYVITLVEQILHIDEAPVVPYFEALGALDLPEIPANAPFGTLFTILRDNTEDPYIISTASSILTLFLGSFKSVNDEVIGGAMNFFNAQLREPKKNTVVYFRTQIKILENLREVLRTDKFKRAFAANQGMKPLFALIALDSAEQVKSFQIQLIYSALYCIWLLTFLKDLRREMVDPVFIRNICFLLKSINKDKVSRLCLAILKNLLRIGDAEKLMISYGLMKSIETIKSKPALVADKDILEDATAIGESLERIVDELTSFDMYRNEVLSYKLEWSPPHKSPKFWTENCFRFEEADNLLLRTLKEILSKEKDSAILIIACWDIGEFVRFHPRGRKILDNLDVKAPIMQLLTSKDGLVESAALLTLQKLLLNNWDLYSGIGNNNSNQQ